MANLTRKPQASRATPGPPLASVRVRVQTSLKFHLTFGRYPKMKLRDLPTATEIDDPEVGPHTFARTVPHLSAAPEIPTEAAPALGAHTREVLEGVLGYSQAEVEGLAAEGVVGV